MAHRATPNCAAWNPLATSVCRSGNRGRGALSQSAIRDKSLPAALRLCLSELQTEISARPPDSSRDCVSHVLPRPQSRRVRSAIPIKADQISTEGNEGNKDVLDD